MIRLTTPATASEPQEAEAPPVTTSTRWMTRLGMVERSTPPIAGGPPELGLEVTTRWPSNRHQGAHHTQAAQVDRIDTRVTLGGVAGMGTIGLRVGLTDGGKFADGVADVDLGVALQGFGADHGDRCGRFIARMKCGRRRP